MKNKIYILLLIMVQLSCNEKEPELIDIDGNEYSVKEYDGTYWTLENLKPKKDRMGDSIKHYFPNDDPTNAKDYGLLYDYETACKICPEGWQLPTNEDWDKLLYANGDSSAIQFKDVEYWNQNSNTNQSMFSVRPTGYGNNGEFDNFFNSKTYFWSKTKDSEEVWTYIFEKGKSKTRKAAQHSTYAFAVRCIKKKKTKTS